MSNWETEFDNLLVAIFRKEDIEGDLIKIYGKDLPTTKAFIQRALAQQLTETDICTGHKTPGEVLACPKCSNK